MIVARFPGRRDQGVHPAVAICLIALSLVFAGCGGSGGGDQTSATGPSLIPGGPNAFANRIEAERGRGVVVNQWASWCRPCAFEFPFLVSQSKKRARTVTFLGVNTTDNRKSAQRFLGRMSVPFDNYFDPDGKIAKSFRRGRGMPTTAFYNRSGKLRFVHIGAYRSEDQLAADIEKHTR